MNERLKLISTHIDNGIGFVDVGTDHGYLPIEMCLNGYNGNVFASDINEDPLNKAKRNAREASVSDKMEFLLCDGLETSLQEKIDTIIIAGMGGDTICAILDKAEWCMDGRYKLILQPMTKAEVLRYWLVYNGFEIKSEELVLENGTIYQIIVTVFGGETVLNDAELFAGKRSLCNDDGLYKENVITLIKRFDKAALSMEKGFDSALDGKIKLYRDIVTQLERLITDA